MLILTAEGLSKAYTEKVLLRSVSLGVSRGDKIGVVGLNGAGKSTLLRILAGEETPDTGTVITAGGVRTAYLSQSPCFAPGDTVLGAVMAGMCGQAEEYECRAILTRLGVADFSAEVALLSGGQKKRVALARALAAPSDLLMLDEPTNHIDSDMIEWLEAYLAKYQGALVMVTHDRYFLDRVTNKIASLERGALNLYEANYAKFLELEAERAISEAAAERKRRALIRRETEWIMRGARARGTKSRYRIERLEELNAQESAAAQSMGEMRSMGARLGKKIIELENVAKRYGKTPLFSGLSYRLLRRDRLGIVGPNGCGKSTLLKLIAGMLPPDEGRVTTGETVRVAFYSQEGEEMDPEMRAIDYIRDKALNVETPDGVLTAAQMMETFLFDGTLQYTPIGRLSGGERRRLALVRLLMEAPNVLLLDEPTNDLDVETLTILEDYLDRFDGAVIAVSHDRYFLDKVADHLFVFENGGIRRMLGGYTEYIEQRRAHAEAACAPKETKKDAPAAPARERAERLRFSFKEQREFEHIEEDIAALEAHIARLGKEMAEKASDFSALESLSREKEAQERILEERMERWMYLNDLAERIAVAKEDV